MSNRSVRPGRAHSIGLGSVVKLRHRPRWRVRTGMRRRGGDMKEMEIDSGSEIARKEEESECDDIAKIL